ncbi:PKS-NRPS hybrid [Xylaria sp. FL1042]|nr:PKS-NRPS hybrid [Xylaria sp. FL1042]
MVTSHEPIAIIGTGCRFPGQSDSPSKLWDLLRKPRDLLKEIPENRFSTDAFYHPQNHHHGTSNVRHSYLLDEDLRNFDAQFFGINSVEAHSVDPQQRLLLETVYESLESAGLSMKEMQGSDTAVYVGVMSADFTDMVGRDTDTFPTYFATGTARSILSNRLSYFFDWHGPSMTIDTACSSSLIAMHQAVQTIRGGDSSMAVVAGSNLILGPEQYIAESKLQMLSPTGRSRMWDANVDGYARGEGVAAVVLKKLSQAIADGDHIECVIRETGTNQDGRTPGITMPSATAQEALIRATYAKAGLDLSKRADRPQFFEAHGTGTPAGDPVEASAISNAFFGAKTHFKPSGLDDVLYVGSIKTVIGHTEGTAGLAAVIKASLAIQAGIIPPNMLLKNVNPKIKPFWGNIQILPAAQKWPKLVEGGVRRVSVNSFGFGGANCHAILESYEPPKATLYREPSNSTTTCFTPFLFSAATEGTLTARLEKYRDYLAGGNATAAAKLRDLAVVPATNDVDELIKKLDDCTDFTSEPSGSKTKGSKPRILGVFTGQGAQSPAASGILARLDKSLQALPSRDRPTCSSSVGTASISQPVCTAVQFSVVDAIRVAYYRAMLALCELPAFEDRVCVAASNSPSSVTLSDEEKKFTRLLKPCSEPYVSSLKQDNKCRWVSSVFNLVMFTEALQVVFGQDGEALKGPASQTIQECLDGNNWGEGAVDFAAYSRFMNDEASAQQFWHESRLSRAFRTAKDPPHELLGRQILDGAPDQLLQRQTVFPCAGYVSAVQSIELLDFVVGQATLVVLDSIKESEEQEVLDMTSHASCDIRVTYGDSSSDSDRFYNVLGELGFGYSGRAQAMLDAGIHMMRSIYLPTGIRRLIINPEHCRTFAGKETKVLFDSSASAGTSRSLSGDAIQLEGLQTQPLFHPTEANDLNIFTELEIVGKIDVQQLDPDLLFSLERVAYFYLRSLDKAIPRSQRTNLEWHFTRLFAYVDHVLSREWQRDTKDVIYKILNKYPDNIDLRLMRAVGENMPAVVRDNIQIGHRYPHMHSFLGALGDKFSTYTFTDISGAHSSRMSFQGFTEGSYDVIIASLTVRNITENDQMRFGLLFGGLEGWWLGYDDGRALSPCVGIEEWRTCLEQNGFSGIETMMPHDNVLPVPLSVIVSQATDDRVELLKQPLRQQKTTPIVVPQLTIIGGTALATDVRQIVGSYCGNVKYIRSLSDIGPDDLPVGGTVLCLSDIEEPVFKSMDSVKLRGFQTVFKQSTNVLWVTQGVRFGDPYARMVVGFGRTIVLEMLHLRLQVLDLDTGAPADPNAIAESLLRFQMGANWENDGAENSPLLHSIEPELYRDLEGRFYIPRFKLNKRPNYRYNSGRRDIAKQISLGEHAVELVQPETQEASWQLVEGKKTPDVKESVEIDVTYSVSCAVEVSRGTFLFPVLGVNRDTAETVLALSPKQASKIRVPRAFVIPAHESADSLQLFYIEHLARAAMRDVATGTLVIVLQPSRMFSRAMDRIAADKGARVLYLTAEPGSEWGYIHPKATKSEIQSVITSRIGTVPPNSVLLLDMGADSRLSAGLLKCLPQEVTQVKAGNMLTSSVARIAPGDLEQQIRTTLVDVKYHLLPAEQDGQSHHELEVVTLEDLTGKGHASEGAHVVSWPSASSTVQVQVEPIHTRVKFRGDKTYWLVGLTGGLGLSLCEWMAQQGARRWVNKMKRLGVHVKVIANNITDRDSVRSVYNKICQKMPAIAGVAQGAMVLHDTVFSELDIERVEKVTKPKVNGSTYLEEIFHDINLDFFVFFSSMACVTGNPGQSAYAAANMFMSGMAAQRRRRGLNASAVHIGAIFGNGYVTRELTLAQQEFLRKVGNMWLSEQDFRQLFAEAIFAGQPENGTSPELSTGLMMIDNSDDSKKNITWFYNPMFQHCIKENQDGELVADGQKGGRGVPVKAQLLEAINPAEVYEIIHDAFAAKLRSSLQIEENRVIVDLTADTLGIDSLFAVDIRSWFIKELQIEIPVLKILGGATVGDILEAAQSLLSKELTPKLDPNDKGEARKKKPQAVKEKPAEKPTKKAPAANEKPSERKAEPKKPRAATPPTVQWQSPPKVVTPSVEIRPSADSDNSSMSSESGVKVSLDASYTEKSTSSNTGARTPASVWSLDTAESEVSVSKKTPIAFGQSRIWFLEMYLKDPASALNITLAIDLNGPLDVNRFERAVKIVGQRHEALRTRFVTGNDSMQTMQEILVEPMLALEKRNITSDEEAEQIYRELQQHRYRLTEGENMRILLLNMSSRSSRLIIGYHHINMDGISLEVILRELQMANILQYPTFAEKQHQEFETGQWRDEIKYWENEFSGTTPPSRTPLTAYSTHTAEFRLDQQAISRIQSACEGSKATPFQFHLAIFSTMLFRLANVEDICIGSVGMYLNLLPILLKSQPNETFASTLKNIRSKAMAAFAHSKVPFDVVVNELGVPRATTHSPLFQVLVNYRPGIAEKRDFCDCRSEIVKFEQGQAAYDLSIDVIESPGECRIIVAGQSALFEQQAVDMLKDMYKNLLTAFSRNPALRLATPSLYDPEGVKNALTLGRGPLRTPQWPETLVHRIDKMAQRYSSKLAVIDGNKTSLTYSQLAKRVGALAASMRGIKSGSRVGVYVDPSTDWICSLLAILRRDAVYVPLDAVSGSGRLFSILQDSQPDLLLVNNATEKDAKIQFASLLTDDQILNISDISTTATGTVSNSAKSDSVAALMYTSGSTGVPKGIVMKHASFRNNIEIITDKLGFREGQEVTLQQSSLNFDMSLFQAFLALSNGGTVHVVPKHLRVDPAAISSIIASHGITFTTATPSELVNWIRYGNTEELRKSNWRNALSGGEPVKDSLRAAFRKVNKPELHLVDCYGPTEITFCSHSREVDYQVDGTSSDARLEVLPNYSTYIVDTNMKAVPVGIPGEIVIGGAGVVAGYLHTELNTRGFANDSFASPEFQKQGWTQLHRTGDFGRIDENGCLVLEGRIMDDTQVKLRGLRIDLREVESAIVHAAKGSIADCAVSVRQSEPTADEYLVAFATTASRAKADNLDKIVHQLPLPPYMKPAALVVLEKMPTSASGKIDRSALKSIPLPKTGSQEDQLSDSEILGTTESRLKQLWEGVLSKEIVSQHQISTTSDFFHVGGSSMLLISLRVDIQDTFNVEVSLFQLFDASTLGGMATLIDNLSSNGSSDIPQDQEQSSDADIDYDAETAVAPGLLSVPVSKQFFTNPEVIVLTGSTGFLGQAILTRLLNDGIVKKIHCLAVRQDIPLFDSPKVVVHRGDLGLPKFGLTEEKLTEIFSEAHAVIHNGTDVSFVKSYHSLKPANVNATKELVRLSLPHHTSFHYISTAAVANLTGQDEWEQRSVGAYLPPAGADGYIATKWVSERYLEKVNDQCELPIWIHRPSSITGQDAPATDLMENMIKFSRKIAAIPDTSAWRGWLDFISVDKAAMQIVDEVYEDYSWPGHVKHLYESGEQVVALSDMKGVLGRESGSVIETVSMEEWVSRAVEEGLNPLLGEYLKRAADTPLVFPRLVRHDSFL